MTSGSKHSPGRCLLNMHSHPGSPGGSLPPGHIFCFIYKCFITGLAALCLVWLHNGVITHLEPDILECKVNWALGSIAMNKASGGDGIPVELFQVLNDDAVKVLHSVFILIPKKGNAKECSNYHIIALISHVSQVMLKILQVRLQ